MSPALARWLTRMYPRSWRGRYGAEFEALLEMGRGDLRTCVNILWSALCERLSPTPGLTPELIMDRDSRPFRFQWWCVRAPWAIFSLGPVLLLAAAYCLACLILWSGWRIFFPGSNTPFVRVEGFAIAYFGVGRLLYYSAPLLIGWGILLIGVRQKIKVVWPAAGSVLLALIGSTAQVHAGRSFSDSARHISMNFALWHSAQGMWDGLSHALVILVLTMLPWVIWRLQKAHSLSA